MALLAVVISGCAGEPAPPPPEEEAPPPPPEKPEVITLKAVSSFPYKPSQPGEYPNSFEPAMEWIDKVQDAADGELVIEYIGGPEVIPSYDQLTALRLGVVDIAFAPAEYLQDIVPATAAFTLARQTPMEMRESGFYDTLNEECREYGVFILGSLKTPLDAFMLYSNVNVQTPDELRGLTFRMDPTVRCFADALGLIYVSIPMADVYASLDRGLVEGFAWAVGATVVSQGWPEVCKYFIDHPFGTVNLVTWISLDAWNRLPNHLQDIMMEHQIETVEKVWFPRWMAENEKATELYQEAGMQPIHFSAADAEWYVDQYYEAEWGGLLEKAPEIGARLKELASD